MNVLIRVVCIGFLFPFSSGPKKRQKKSKKAKSFGSAKRIIQVQTCISAKTNSVMRGISQRGLASVRRLGMGSGQRRTVDVCESVDM